MSALSNARRLRAMDQGRAFSRVPVAREGFVEVQYIRPSIHSTHRISSASTVEGRLATLS